MLSYLKVWHENQSGNRVFFERNFKLLSSPGNIDVLPPAASLMCHAPHVANAFSPEKHIVGPCVAPRRRVAHSCITRRRHRRPPLTFMQHRHRYRYWIADTNTDTDTACASWRVKQALGWWFHCHCLLCQFGWEQQAPKEREQNQLPSGAQKSKHWRRHTQNIFALVENSKMMFSLMTAVSGPIWNSTKMGLQREKANY